MIARRELHVDCCRSVANFGFDRGNPIDRYYIEDFCAATAALSEYTPGAIHGHVLEVGGDTYTRQFGLGVERIDILDASPENPRATIVADLTDGSNLPSDIYDCVICLQTLLFIYDVKAAIRTHPPHPQAGWNGARDGSGHIPDLPT